MAIEEDQGVALRRMAPGQHAAVVTPNDSNDNVPKGSTLWIGGAGDLVAIPEGQDAAVTFTGVPVGPFNVCNVRRVETGSTCTDIVAIW
jgi:hypothetical protein